MNILNFLGFDRAYQDASLILFGAPYDGTTSFRPGTRFGPMAARQESFGIETYSPYLDADLEEYACCDLGDLEFPFGNKERVLEMIEEQAATILADDKIPLMIGGEHLVSYGAIAAASKKYPDLHIIHFDAHADLRPDYLGDEFSHATVIRRAYDLVGDKKIFQFGIRSGLKEEFEFAQEHTTLQKFTLEGLEQVVETLQGKPVYVTIDQDVLDPSFFPGTGTPEPGGLCFHELLRGIHLLKGLKIAGADIVELSPHYDQSGISTAVTCKLVREMALTILSYKS